MGDQRLGGMRVQVERVYEGPEVGWDEGTSGEREYEGPEVGWDEGTSGESV